MHALGTCAEFGGGLGTAQQKLGQQGAGGGLHRIFVVESLAEFGHAGIGAREKGGEAFLTQSIERLFHFAIVERENGRAVAALIAGIGQRIEAERVNVGGGEFFLNQAAECAGFRGGEEGVGRGIGKSHGAGMFEKGARGDKPWKE